MDLNALVDQIKRRIDYEKVGMILCHQGVVRGVSRDGTPVRGLRVAVNNTRLEQVIETFKARPGIVEILIQINADHDLMVGEDVMALVVAGDMRENVITVLTELLNIIKKEVTRKTEYPA
ncbi:MAG: molybdenum cofactor biosynthesis protein MoaE [Desulfatitalea sp.]|nr:molybdenum cofactor biosynthesis protein MoaE [Desulfatitalea sp.]NNJ98837.1 molybdenum cofactor biosynthesis protein MoaE [Desulfatitalea sp.]